MDIDEFAQRLVTLEHLLSSQPQGGGQPGARIENALEESRQYLALLEAILKNSPAGLAVVSGPGLVFRLATQAYRQLLPPNEGEIIGLPYERVWRPEYGNTGEQLIRRILSSDKEILFDRLEYGFPDGQTHSFSMRACRVQWRGEPAALIMMQETTQTDRTRRLVYDIAEEANRQAVELDAIITAMAEAVTIFNAQGIAARANPAAMDLFGFDPIGLNYPDLMDLLGVRSPDGAPIEPGAFFINRALKGETITDHLVLLVNQDQSERVVRVSASPLFDEVQVTAVVTVWHDVTERERLLEQLEIEQARLQTIIANAPEAILVVDDEGRLVLSNPAGERIFGRDLPYEEGYESFARLQIHYDDGTPCAPRNFSLICSALDGESFTNQELLVRLPNGSIRNILASTAPIVDRKGNVNGAVGVFQDITTRKQAEAALREQAARSQMMAMLSRAFAETGLHVSELLETITHEVGRVFGDVCSLHLLSDDGEQFRIPVLYTNKAGFRDCLAAAGADRRFPARANLTGEAVNSGKPALLAGQPAGQFKAMLGEAYNLLVEKWYSPSLCTLVVPLRAHGRRIGTINVFRILPGREFSAEDQAFLQDLADRAALAIENALLFEREMQRARELQALHKATTSLLSTIDLETLLEQIMESAALALPAARQGILYLLSDQDNRLEVRAEFGCSSLNKKMPELQAYAAQAAREFKPLIVPSLQVDGDALPHCEDGTPAGTWSAIVAPLYLTEREPQPSIDHHPQHPQRAIGALALFGPRPNLFTSNDLRLLSSFAATATAALQNARLYAEVQRLAITDPVTEQFNRRKFIELGVAEMHRFRRFQTPLSAIMLDLDNFKGVNDMYGHAVGDQVLRGAAQRCKSTIRVVDILGRYGGDEFAILLPGADLHEALEIAERLRQAITTTPVDTSQGPVSITISLGVAQAHLEMETIETLLAKADAALYQAKQAGRNRVIPD